MGVGGGVGDGRADKKATGVAICLTLGLKLLDEPLGQELIFSEKSTLVLPAKQKRPNIM